MRYPGGKGKCYQRLINLMPPHQTYIESHLGGGAVMRHKRPARTNIGIDIDDAVIERWRREHPSCCSLVHADAVSVLESFPFTGGELIYADPPYLPNTRRRTKVYRHEYSEADHDRLISVLLALPCMVMLSGYASALYRSRLHDWRLITFSAKTHHGVREECVWLNFEAPASLHDGLHLGASFRDRQTIRRRLARLADRFECMEPVERNHALQVLNERYGLSQVVS